MPRPQGPRCDIGAYEASQGVPLLVLPNHGGNGGSVVAIVYGLGAPDGSTVKLSRAGQPDIPGDPVAVDGSSVLGTSFDLTGKMIGSWDVVVTKPDHSSATISQGFTIEDTRLPTVWVDVIGRTVVRVGRPALFTVLFGNRGNVDALAVPLVLTIPAEVTVALGFQVMPPPPQAGQVPTDWSQVPVAPRIDGLTYVPLLLPVVPAGFTGTLELRVTAQPASTDMSLEINAQIGAGTAVSLLDADGVDRLVADAQVYAEHTLGIAIPPSRLSALTQYVTTQLQNAVAHGRSTAVSGAGTGMEVYSSPQLIADAAKFAAALSTASASPGPGPVGVASRDAASSSLSSEPSDQAPLPGTSRVASIARRIATLLFHWMAAMTHTLVALLQPGQAEAADSQSCAENGLAYDSKTGRCVGCVGSFCGGGISPFTPKASRDPNDKVGTQGAGAARFVTATDPLRYSVFFENTPTASLPAQEVVITDQLDAAKMDLDTFSLGPLSFGSIVVVPTPGLAQFSTSVDLRPSKNLVVAIDAGLDKASGLVTWRFSSLDPATLQAPDDPAAGFLPPNNAASDGEGSVLFTVKLKAGLAAGTQITNRASVVFDVNAPIDTPQWLNTIDSRHDLAITRITVPATVFLGTARVTRRVTVQIQNRGVNPEVIAGPSALGALVTLTMDSLGACPAPRPVLRPPARFPITLRSRQQLGVVFDVSFDCANDGTRSTAKNPGHGDYEVSARLDLSALGHVDSHPDDDVCPRSVPPSGVIDPNPAGTILDKGCGTYKADRTFGGTILIDVLQKP